MRLSKGYFVIGTDTGIGKTYVSTLLYKGVSQIGGGYYKPVQSGAFQMLGGFVSPDAEFLCKFNNIPYDKDMTTYLLKAETSPHLAAEIDNINIEPEKIIEHWEKLKEKYSTLIVEGAGGLCVPIVRSRFYMYDLIKMLDIPVIIAARNCVGTINHTMLTVNALKSMGIKIQGFVFNCLEQSYDKIGYEKDNIDIIKEMSRIDNYMVLKYGQEAFPQKELLNFLAPKEE